MSTLTARIEDTDTVVSPGDTVTDFRNQQWTFVKATRASGNGKSGKVVVSDEFGRQREFYDGVFDLEVTEEGEPNASDEKLVTLIRTICAHEFGLPYEREFFKFDYQDGETADQALLRIFKAERPNQDSDTETVLVLING